MSQTKSYSISKQLVWEAYKRVKANRGAAGVDNVSLKEYEKRLKDNLYKLWNRMSSGSYFPPAVKQVEIPKKVGGSRPLGIPTVEDRIAQMVVKMVLEPEIEPSFHEDSYGYRLKKSAIEAVGVTRKRCWRYDWVIDLDIRGFFENLDHTLLMRAVEHHATQRWVVLYIKRWLEAPIEKESGQRVERQKGTPQGGVISPLLANLYLHYAFDMWISNNHLAIRFERYADDIVIHCVSEEQAKNLLRQITERLRECKLEVHPEKTKIVYCKDDNRKGNYSNESFDFLGYTYEGRSIKTKQGEMRVSFIPAMSKSAGKRMRQVIRRWRIHSHTNKSVEEIAKYINPVVRGWINYYGKYFRSKLWYSLYLLNKYLVKWVFRRYKRFRNRQWARANDWLGRIAQSNPSLFAHWNVGFKPTAG